MKIATRVDFRLNPYSYSGTGNFYNCYNHCTIALSSELLVT